MVHLATIVYYGETNNRRFFRGRSYIYLELAAVGYFLSTFAFTAIIQTQARTIIDLYLNGRNARLGWYPFVLVHILNLARFILLHVQLYRNNDRYDSSSTIESVLSVMTFILPAFLVLLSIITLLHAVQRKRMAPSQTVRISSHDTSTPPQISHS